jgi:hypothetical protein
LNYDFEQFDAGSAALEMGFAAGSPQAAGTLLANNLYNKDRHKVKTNSETPAWEIRDIEGELSTPKKKIHGRTVYYVADFYIDQLKNEYNDKMAEKEKQFLWIEPSIDYVDFVLTDMQLHDSP